MAARTGQPGCRWSPSTATGRVAELFLLRCNLFFAPKKTKPVIVISSDYEVCNKIFAQRQPAKTGRRPAPGPSTRHEIF
jgi:hypothetical protein